MAKVAIVYFSGYGHTTKQAQAVREGAGEVEGASASLITISPEGEISDADWSELAAADAIIFGSPTYMAGPAWQFKKFADATSKPWFTQSWKDKIAAGFTNSASPIGDKPTTIIYLMTLAMQHGMIWIGTGMMPSSQKTAQRNDINFFGSFSGLVAQSPADATPDEGPFPGDLATARLFGARVAGYAVKTRG